MDKEQEKAFLFRQRLQTTVFAQCFSPCGKFLATCNNFGKMALFSLSTALSPEATEESWKPIFTFKGHSGPVYTLATTDRLLISGGTGDICAWNWTDLIINKAPKLMWSLSIPPSDDRFANPETNCIIIDNENNRLLAGCGDSKIHIWDLDSGRYLRSFKGHEDYIHSIALRNNGKECLSASEDGSVRIWDTRKSETLHIIEPYKNDDCARPRFGKWIGCVAVDKADDWMVCGGGPRLCLWHLRSLAATTVFDTPNAYQNHAMFYEDTVITAGSEAFVHHWSVNGDHRAKVPCTPTCVFSVAINDKSDNTKVLSIGGNSHKIDICTNFGYKAFCMTVC